jgi:hypothetical protein
LGFNGAPATLRRDGFVFQTTSGGPLGIRDAGFAMSRSNFRRNWLLFLLAAEATAEAWWLPVYFHLPVDIGPARPDFWLRPKP